MADQGLWFKLWCSAPSDPDISNLSLEDFGRWCLLGAYLKVHGNNGIISIPKPARALQNVFRCSTYEEVILVLRKFPNCDVREEGKRETDAFVSLLVTWKNWSKYQGDYSSIRTRKWRERERFKRRGEEKRGEETRREEKRVNTLSRPTLLEIQSFAVSEKLNIDVHRFYNYYEANGWKVGRNPMKDWKAAARNWKPEGQHHATASKPANAFTANATESGKYDNLGK